MYKKTISIIMTVAMTFALFTGMTLSASAYTATDTMENLYNSGNSAVSGTYYSICDKDELENFRDYVNAGKNTLGVTFFLESDITLNNDFEPDDVNPAVEGVPGYEGSVAGITEWIPIGGALAGYSFKGVFDGQNYTVNNIFYNRSEGSFSSGNSRKNNAGLFGKLEEGAIIQNLKISGGYFGAQRSIGGIVGKSWGTIINCHNLGTYVYGNQSKGVGGIVGANWVNTTTNPPEVLNCTNAGTVVSAYSSGSAGGIAGENEGQIYSGWY